MNYLGCAFSWFDTPYLKSRFTVVAHYLLFRHYAAYKMINEGVELAAVRDILGHADFRSTLVYARIKKEKLLEAMRVFNGWNPAVGNFDGPRKSLQTK